jgi:hypothetical protein
VREMPPESAMFTDDHPVAVSDAPRRRWRFWLLLIGAPLLVLVMSGVGWVIRSTSDLQAAIAETDRLDPRWRLDEIEADRATPPPGQNAVDKIMAVKRLQPAGWPNIKMNDLFNDLPPVNQLNSEQIATLTEFLEPAGPAVAEARSLIDTPLGRHPIVFSPDWISTLLPTIQDARLAAGLLRYDVFAKAQAGDMDGAIRSCHAAFHAGSSLGDEPFLIAQLVRIACQAIAIGLLERTLAQGERSDGVLAALQARLEATEPEPILLYGMRGERAGEQKFFQGIRDGSIPAGAALAPAGGGGMQAPLNYLLRLPGFVASQQAGLLRYMNEMVAIANLPPEQWQDRFAAQQANAKQLPMLAQSLAPAVDKVAGATQRNHASLRCAIVAIAAERHRRQKGQWPATPDDLVKAGLIKSVPTDPFAAGQSIKFARPVDGLIVYTTGADGKDDGGKLDKDVRKVGFDFGFRLWDVAARRQPPLPPKVETP